MPGKGATHTELHRLDDVADLREQIEGKNELIAALVAELEQVAEQLDRAKRSGSDRPRAHSTTAGLPSEVVEEHQQVLGELQQVVRQWEELQAASTLGRIENQIAELRALVAGNGRRGFDANEYSEECPTESTSLDAVMSRLGADSNTEEPPDAESPGANWEAMKRQMLGQPPAAEVEDDSPDELVGLLNGLASPLPVDIESAPIEILKQACAERETYIVQVTRWVRTRRTVSLPPNWDELQGVPDELRRQVNTLVSRLEEQVRLAEVEMSLERARLSREKSQLQADRAVMDKHLKRLGISSLDELEDIAINSSSSSDRRWMRFLGVNRKS